MSCSDFTRSPNALKPRRVLVVDMLTPEQAQAHAPTSRERVDHAITHLMASARERFRGDALVVDVVGLGADEREQVTDALRPLGWRTHWTTGVPPLRRSITATLHTR